MSYLQHPIYEVGKPHPAIARIRKRREQQYHSVDLSLLERVDPALLDAYDSGQRVKVRPACPGGEAWERTGRVSITTGPTPVLLLIHRSNSIGSWDTLEAGDE
ncbi:MAG TPA: hypothetical protein VJ777_19245, partial [Mycobacterium sp.]|nr:hypothetical protein [Mycobacterium sp.]